MENMDEKTLVKVYCADCGSLIDELTEEAYEDLIASNGYAYHNGRLVMVICGDVYCNSCKDDLAECNECGGFENKDDMYVDANGDYYCEHCKNTVLSFCERCERYFRGELSTVYTDANKLYYQEWCDDCVSDHSVECSDCGDLFDDDVTLCQIGAWYSDTHVCASCFYRGDYDRCADCGNYVSTDALECINGELYCGNCVDTHRKTVIYRYHRYPTNWEFCDTNEIANLDKLRTQKCFSGVELEIDRGGCDDDNAITITTAMGYPADQFDDLRCSMDVSLDNGFEIISNPCTYEFHLSGIDWEKGMKKAEELGYRSHDGGKCGIHFHLDRRYFEGSMVNPENAFIVMLSNNAAWLKLFSRREDYRYCAFKDNQQYTVEGFKKGLYGPHLEHMRRMYRGEVDAQGAHSGAINFEPNSTIEVRFVRGTLKYSTYVASLQLMQMLAYAAKHFRYEQLATVDLRWFRRTAKRQGYKEFLDYIDERGIMS